MSLTTIVAASPRSIGTPWDILDTFYSSLNITKPLVRFFADISEPITTSNSRAASSLVKPCRAQSSIEWHQRSSNYVGSSCALVAWCQVLIFDPTSTDGDFMIEALATNKNPYPIAIASVEKGLYLRVSVAVVNQFRFLIALFTVSLAFVLLGFVLRLFQGRFWLYYRIDSRVTIPNILVHYSIWAVCFIALSIFGLDTTIKCASGTRTPGWYISLQGILPLALFLGQYSEVWATAAGYAIRRYGVHNGDPPLVSLAFTFLPALCPLVILVPSIATFVLAAQNFAQVGTSGAAVLLSLKISAESWVPGEGLVLSQLEPSLHNLGLMMKAARWHAHYTKIAFAYTGVSLSIMFALISLPLNHFFFSNMQLYVMAAIVEVGQLRSQAKHLKSIARVGAEPDTDSGAPSSPVGSPREAAHRLNDRPCAQLRAQSELVEWAASNRLLTATLISLTLLVNAAFAFWFATKPISLANNNHRFSTIVLVSAWVNSTLLTLVAILILFRSLDGSNPAAKRMIKILPWMTRLLPPSVGLDRLQDATYEDPASTKLHNPIEQPTTVVKLKANTAPANEDSLSEKSAMTHFPHSAQRHSFHSSEKNASDKSGSMSANGNRSV
ncbi:BZ3500_MvSof-1268-A1-R1_Chr10-1g02567 [Microbotryum saponariae]|uniref:BZ3500_MvSof-1268-A1-R1_Chr10-1g02567 protein n=1 Tax=Microbotryum saponariae TaxID=289078 RepID=A0A2X0L9C4_9BASI|nr:BZ3500_MvSof-1268-A1-R1_Chr10-1g02567 [Microbotryum saponariae]SDA06056.1 BZ3501_MvSof-1269-A2-R1_Chr10-1g02168 [Microbotryum saponariae]